LFVKQREMYISNKGARYSVIWGQCMEAMQANIKSNDSYDNMHEDSNSLELIKVICKSLSFSMKMPLGMCGHFKKQTPYWYSTHNTLIDKKENMRMIIDND
jgi:hypothetical protein